jgi:hypothetical protein
MTLFLHVLLGAVLLVASGMARSAPEAPQAATNRDGESIDVTVRGRLKSGVVAIGAETTGVTITASGVVWDLELNARQLETAGNLDGRRVVVTGRLVRRDGVELRDRFVVKVRSIRAGT